MSGTGKEKNKVDKGADRSDTCVLQLLRSVADIKAIQDDLYQINARADKEALKLEHKFDAWRKPFYARRNEIIQLIRDFWLVTFCNHPVMGDLLTERDKKILKNMVLLDVEEAHNVKPGFSISFSFSPNPYFENEKLTKGYWFDHDGNLTVESDSINWKDSKGIFDGCSFDEGKRPHTSESFFCWFSDIVRFDGEVDAIANIVRGDLWPNPLQYFLKKVDAVGSNELQDGQADSQDSEVTGGGNEADDEREGGEEYEDHYVKHFRSCTAEDIGDGELELNQDYCEEDGEYDEGYEAEVDEDGSIDKDN